MAQLLRDSPTHDKFTQVVKVQASFKRIWNGTLFSSIHFICIFNLSSTLSLLISLYYVLLKLSLTVKVSCRDDFGTV